MKFNRSFIELFHWWLSIRPAHLNTNKNILFQGCFSLLYVLMEFHPFIAHGIAPECGASNIRHKSTPNEAQSTSGETLWYCHLLQ